MASSIIHICVAKKINEKIKRENKNYYLGAIAPDLSKHVGKSKKDSHFLSDYLKQDVPDINKFLDLYRDDTKKDFELGYLIHLYTDKLWFDGFIDNLVVNSSVKLLDGTIVTTTAEEIKSLLYDDYTSMNTDLIDLYNLDLSLFYEEFDYPESNIKEIPIDKLYLIVEKMGIIIENSKTEKNMIFDISSIVNFIEEASWKTYEFLETNNLLGEKE